MIDWLELTNFMSYKHLKLEFVKGINTFVGETDAGKTVIIHALKFLLLDDSRREGVINFDADSCEVAVGIDGHVIKKTKSRKGENYYTLGDRKFGAAMPDEIADIVGVNFINVQDQSESHFLLSDSEPEVNRKFNQIIDLGLIDTSLDCAEQTRRQILAETTAKEKEKEIFEKKIDDLDWLESAGKLLERCENLSSELDEKTKIEDDVNALIRNLSDAFEKLAKIDRLLSECDDCCTVNELELLFRDYEKASAESENVTLAINDIERVEENILNRTRILDDIAKVCDIGELDNDFAELKSVRDRFEDIKSVLNSINRSRLKIEEFSTEIERLEKELSEIETVECPTCGTIVPANRINSMKGE